MLYRNVDFQRTGQHGGLLDFDVHGVHLVTGMCFFYVSIRRPCIEFWDRCCKNKLEVVLALKHVLSLQDGSFWRSRCRWVELFNLRLLCLNLSLRPSFRYGSARLYGHHRRTSLLRESMPEDIDVDAIKIGMVSLLPETIVIA